MKRENKVKAKVWIGEIHRDIKITKLDGKRTTLQKANQSIATAKVDRKEKKGGKNKNVSKPPLNVRGKNS